MSYLDDLENDFKASFNARVGEVAPPPAAAPVPPAEPGAPRTPGDVTRQVLSGPGAYALRGAAEGAAWVGDNIHRAAGWLTGAPEQPVGPLERIRQEYIEPGFEGTKQEGFGGMVQDAAQFAGELATPMGVGGAAVKGVANVARKVAPGGARLIDLYSRFGTGPGLGGGLMQNLLARIGAGAAATGTAAIAADPSNPQGAAVSAAAGGVVGPVGQKVADMAGTGARFVANQAADRAPLLAEEVIRRVMGDRAPEILTNIAQRNSRITPGLPAQVMNDPGAAALHRGLAQTNPAGFGHPVTDFLEDQKGQLAGRIKGEFSGLDKLKEARGTQFDREYMLAKTNPTPIDTTPIRDQLRRLESGGNLAGNYDPGASPFYNYVGKFIKPVGDGTEELLPQVPLGELFNTRKKLSEKLSAPYHPAKPDNLEPSTRMELKDMEVAMDRSIHGSNTPAGDMVKDLDRRYAAASRPINAKEQIKGIYDNSRDGVLTRKGAEQLSPNALATNVAKLEDDKVLMKMLNPTERKLLRQARIEAPGNENSLTYGSGTAIDDITKSALPNTMMQLTRPLPGMSGRTLSAGTRLMAGKQVGRIEDFLSEIMKRPDGVMVIERILKSNPGAIPPGMVERFARWAPGQAIGYGGNRLLGTNMGTEALGIE